MTVYVEYVFLDNFIIDWVLITLARKSLKLSAEKGRVCLASLVGATFAVCFPFFRVNAVVGLLIKGAIGLLIVFFSGKFRSCKQFIKCFYLFLFFTFLSGGFVTAVFWGLGLNFDPVSYSNGGEIPLFLILLLIIICYRFSVKVIKTVYKRKEITSFTVKCAMEIGGKRFDLIGFLDSGNSLVYKGENPVVICSLKLGKKLQKLGALDCSEVGETVVKTVSGVTIIKVYKTKKFLIYNGEKVNILYNVMIGLAKGEITCGNEYDLLLCRKICEVI